MNKVWLHTYWLMWGKESGKKSKIIDRAWLTAILPPFYRGTGISIRIGTRSLKFGVCYPRMPVTVDDYSYVDDFDENLEALLGYEMKEQEIRKWHDWDVSDLKKQQDQSTQTSSDESSNESLPETS